MKTLINYVCCMALVFLYSCSGSDTYRGAWKAVNSRGEKFDVVFEAKSFTFKDSSGQVKTYKYRQNSVSIQNGIETYGIQVSDDNSYQISFPIANDETKGVIKDGSGTLIYLIGRNSYPKYEDIFGLQ